MSSKPSTWPRLFNTIILSKSLTVEIFCAIIIVVICLDNLLIESLIKASLLASTALVESSRLIFSVVNKRSG